MKKITQIILFILFANQILAQDFQWTVVTSPATSYGNAIVKPDNNGDMVTVTQYGKPLAGGVYLKYALLDKYNNSGTLLDQDTLRNFYVYDFAVAADNSIFIAGYINEDTSYVANQLLTQIGSAYVIRYFSSLSAEVIINSKDSSGTGYMDKCLGFAVTVITFSFMVVVIFCPEAERRSFLQNTI